MFKSLNILVFIVVFGFFNQTQAQQVVLNEGKEDLYYCGTPLKLYTSDSSNAYNWLYPNGNVVSQSYTVTVSEPGNYVVFDQSGSGTNINVIDFSKEITFAGVNSQDSVLQICRGSSFLFDVEGVSSSDVSKFDFQWYFNGQEIAGATFKKHQTSGLDDQFGVYEVRVAPKGENDSQNENCTYLSKEIELKSFDSTTFNVSATGELNRVFFKNSSAQEVLEISHNAGNNVIIQWFKDSVPIPGTNFDAFPVRIPGVYHAEVNKTTSSGCVISESSEEFYILEPVSLRAVLVEDSNYQECSSVSSSLRVDQVLAVDVNGDEFPLLKEQSDRVDFEWFKDGQEVSLSDSKTTLVEFASYLDNGVYKVNSIYTDDQGVATTGFSNDFTLKLTISDTSFVDVVSSSENNIICGDNTIVLSVPNYNDSYSYKWFKDGDDLNNSSSELSVTEVGSYELQVQAYDCVYTNEIVVTPFQNDSVVVLPSESLILVDQDYVEFQAAGADSYQWFSSDDSLVSSDDFLRVSEIGVYKLVGRFGECFVEKQVEVLPNDGKNYIQNIISPFVKDGVHDYWELPNRFAFDKNVTVIIYDSVGNELLNQVSYQNNWPQDLSSLVGFIYYFKIMKNDELIKAGTLSLLKN